MITNVIRTLTLRGKAEGVVETTAAMKGLQTATDNLNKSAIASTATSETQAKRQLSLADAVAKNERRFNSQLRAQQDFEKVQRQMNAAVAQNPALQERANAVLALAAQHFKNAGAANDNMSKAMREVQAQASALASRLGPLGGILTAMGPTGLIAAVALGGLAAAFTLAGHAALALADKAGKLRDFSETTGFAVEQIQALQIAGQGVGRTAEQVTQHLERFSVAFETIKDSGHEANKTMKQIDAGLTSQLVHAANLTQAYDIYTKILEKADLTQRNLLARQVGGRGGIGDTRLAAAVREAGGVEKLTAAMERQGIITTQQAKRWDDLADEIVKSLDLARTAIVSTFAEGTLTQLNNLATTIKNVAFAIKDANFTDSPFIKFLGKLGDLLGIIGSYTLTGMLGNLANDISSASSSPLKLTVNPSTGPASVEATAEINARLSAMENLKRSTLEAAAASEKMMSALGSAATASQQYRNSQLQLDKAIVSTTDTTERALLQRGKQLLAEQRGMQLEDQRIGVLGQLKTIEDEVTQKRNELTRATRDGVSIGEAQKNQLLEIARLQAVASKSSGRVGALGEAATDAEKYASAIDQLNVKLADGTLNQQEFNRAVLAANPLFKEMKDLSQDFAKTFVHGLIEGKSAAEALSEALKGLGMKLLDKGIDQLVNQAMSAVSGALGGTVSGAAGATTAATIWTTAGTAFNASLIAAATTAAGILGVGGATAGTEVAVGGAVAGVETAVGGATGGAALAAGGAAAGLAIWGPIALLAAAGAAIGLSMFGGGAAAKAEKERIEKAQKAWEEAKGAAALFIVAMEGGSAGTIKPAIDDAFDEQLKFAILANDAGDRESVLKVQDAYNTFVTRTIKEFWDNIDGATDRLAKGFGPDSDFSKGADAVQDMGDKLKAFVADAEFMTEEWGDLGDGTTLTKATDAAVSFARTLLRTEEPLSDTAKALEEVNGGASTLEQVLIDLGETAAAAADIVATELDAAVADLGSDLVTSITRDIFDARGESHFLDMEEAVADLFTNIDDLIATGRDTAWADVLFKEQAQQIVDENGLIGESFDSLIELFPILSGVVTESADALQDAADEAADALQKIQDGINDAAGTILEYVNGLLAGSESGLSPSARLSAAQSSYGTQLTLAQSGDVDAQSGITSYAEDLRDAAEAMYGSTAQYQAIFDQIVADLTTLPAVTAADDPVVVALRDAILSIDDVTKAIKTELTTAVNAGNATATALALTTMFDEIDLNVDGQLTQSEVQNALGNMVNQAALKTMFQTLDVDNSGSLTKTEIGNAAKALPDIKTSLGTTGTIAGALGTTGTIAGALGTTGTIATALGETGTLDKSVDDVTTWVAAVEALQTTANSTLLTSKDLLTLMKDQLTLTLTTAITTGNPDSPTVDNNMLSALNKIVLNTWVTAKNLESLISGATSHENPQLAAGGYISGHGTGTSDTAGLFALSNGEGVLTAWATARLGGSAAIDNLNRGMIPVVPVSMPYRAGNDNSASIIAALERNNVALLRRIDVMEKTLVRAGLAAGGMVREGVDNTTRVVAAGQRGRRVA